MRPSAASRRRPGLALAAAALASALLGAGAVWLALGDDRDLASAYRETLEVADGEYLDAAPLDALAGGRIGEVFGYQGETPWVLVIVASGEPGRVALSPGRYEVELIRAGGDRLRLPPLEVTEGPSSTSSVFPGSYAELRELRVLTPAGEEVAEAELGPSD
jgi:hypothetical protein